MITKFTNRQLILMLTLLLASLFLVTFENDCLCQNIDNEYVVEKTANDLSGKHDVLIWTPGYKSNIEWMHVFVDRLNTIKNNPTTYATVADMTITDNWMTDALPADISGYEMICVFAPGRDITSTENTNLGNFLAIGGRLLMLGECTNYSSQNNRLKNCANSLNAKFSIGSSSNYQIASNFNVGTALLPEKLSYYPTGVGVGNIIPYEGKYQWIAQTPSYGSDYNWMVDFAAGPTDNLKGRVTVVLDMDWVRDGNGYHLNNTTNCIPLIVRLLEDSSDNKQTVTDGGNPNSNVKLAVTFHNLDHGTQPSTIWFTGSTTVNKPDDLTADGYTFGGWYTTPECSTQYTFQQTVTTNVDIYAKWTVSGSNLSPAPVAQSATEQLVSSFIANWNTTSTAQSYMVEIHANADCSDAAAQTITTTQTSYEFTNLAFQKWYYRVKATNSTGESVFSNIITVEPKHRHCVCGVENCTEHYVVDFTEWTSSNSLPTQPGNYYLANNVTMSSTYNPKYDINLCLNGHSITFTESVTGNAITDAGNKYFNITDCKTTGIITSEGASTINIPIYVTFGIFGGTITNTKQGKKAINVQSSGYLTVGGKAKIKGSAGSNVYLNKSMILNVSPRVPLTGDASIGITTSTAPTSDTPVAISSSNSSDYSKYFFADNASYCVGNKDNVLKLFAANTLSGNLTTGTYDKEYKIDGTVTIPAGVTVTLTGGIHENTANQLIIKEGGQLKTAQVGLKATVEKNISSWTNKDAGGWYTISSPVAGITTSAFVPATNYDLFRYDEPTHCWINSKHETQGWSDIETGRGYLYAEEIARTMQIGGELNSDEPTYNLTYTSTLDELIGFNLLGNPYTQNITLNNISLSNSATFNGSGYYTLSNSGTWSAILTGEIAPCTGFLVQVDKTTTATFSKTTSSKGDKKHASIAIRVANSEFEDTAYALFSDGNGLDKISHHNADAPMIYITQDNFDYAIAIMSENTTMFPVSFEAATTGYYTISLKSSQIYEGFNDFNYLHLIDNVTGDDIDMLAKGEYRFIASPTDNTNRFTVMLHRDGVDEIEIEEGNFVYQSGNELIINGEGTLQVFDMLGRIVISQEFEGGRISINGLTTGTYVIRIIGTNIKTQKIIIR